VSLIRGFFFRDRLRDRVGALLDRLREVLPERLRAVPLRVRELLRDRLREELLRLPLRDPLLDRLRVVLRELLVDLRFVIVLGRDRTRRSTRDHGQGGRMFFLFSVPFLDSSFL
jgi:hypothetical protein